MTKTNTTWRKRFDKKFDTGYQYDFGREDYRQFIEQEMENLCKEFEGVIGEDEETPSQKRMKNIWPEDNPWPWETANQLRAELREKLKKIREGI